LWLLFVNPQLPPSHHNKQVSTHLKRIEAVEKDLKALSETTAAKDDFTKLRAEVKKLYDGLHIGLSRRLLGIASGSLISREEFLDLRNHVWGIRGYIRYPTTNYHLMTMTSDIQSKTYKLFRKKSEVLFD